MKGKHHFIILLILIAFLVFGTGFFSHTVHAVTPKAAAELLIKATQAQNAAWKCHYYFKASEEFYKAASSTFDLGVRASRKGDKVKAKQLNEEGKQLRKQADYYYDLAEKYRKEALRQGLGGLLKTLGH
jgi:hypothetical protein